MRIASPGHVVFAATMIALGIVGFITHDFAGVWGGVPEHLPNRDVLAYVSAFVALASGAGLLLRRTATLSALVLLVYLTLWLIVFKAPFIFRAPMQEVSYQTCGETATIVAAAWVLYIWFATDGGKPRLGFVASDAGLRSARVLYGLALIAFGLSHFFYVQMTAPLIPSWMLWPLGWAYFTGGAYLAAGVAIIVGVLARLAATLVAVQIALISLIVWPPIIASGQVGPFQWGEVVVTCVLTGSAWVIAESYRGAAWFALLGGRKEAAA